MRSMNQRAGGVAQAGSAATANTLPVGNQPAEWGRSEWQARRGTLGSEGEGRIKPRRRHAASEMQVAQQKGNREGARARARRVRNAGAAQQLACCRALREWNVRAEAQKSGKQAVGNTAWQW